MLEYCFFQKYDEWACPYCDEKRSVAFWTEVCRVFPMDPDKSPLHRATRICPGCKRKVSFDYRVYYRLEAE